MKEFFKKAIILAGANVMALLTIMALKIDVHSIIDVIGIICAVIVIVYIGAMIIQLVRNLDED